MSFVKKSDYIRPMGEIIAVQSLSFLEYFSGNGDIAQWEDGEDLGDTEDYLP